jgi:hypothetical protein
MRLARAASRVRPLARRVGPHMALARERAKSSSESTHWPDLCIGTLCAMSASMRTSRSEPHANKPAVDAVDELAQTILSYVTSCPDAADTIDGICEWWIPRQRYVQAKSEVLAALELLEARGQIHTRIGADGQVLYRARSVPSS